MGKITLFFILSINKKKLYTVICKKYTIYLLFLLDSTNYII